MRLLVLIIIVLLLAYAWWPEHEPVPVEDTVIGQELKPLHKAQQFEEKGYLDALDKHRQQMDAQENKAGGD